jgi:hypothetical protein
VAAAAATSTVGYIDPEYYRLQELSIVLLELLIGRKAIHQTSQDSSGSRRNIIEFVVAAVETGSIARILDDRVPMYFFFIFCLHISYK